MVQRYWDACEWSEWDALTWDEWDALMWREFGTGPHRVAIAEGFSTGRRAGEVLSAGASAGEGFSTGRKMAEVDGKSN